ncbi:M23 family metallopeptidase [Arthrobacter sp. PM3]|uniref:M23 family metallopeptidase n=1 Tax=Arthrobacter sp. PM3 TaxID=2017685 RepID=UPI000E106385|nr:hypothetical protein CFN17_13650 [Arthrobacter sp. PM3]
MKIFPRLPESVLAASRSTPFRSATLLSAPFLTVVLLVAPLAALPEGPALALRASPPSGRAGAGGFGAPSMATLGPARAGPAPVSGWGWPLSPRPTLLRAFDPPARPWLSGHRGVDLAAANDGAPLLAPAAGTVVFVGFVVDRPVITLDHGNGLRSSFEPASSELAVGASVAAGGVLGHVRAGHCGPSPPCVHWGLRRGDEYVNPLAFVMDLRPSVLLPPLAAGAPGPGAQAAARARLPGGAGPARSRPALPRRPRRPRQPVRRRGVTPGADQTIAEIPVIARPVTRVLISCVPS